MSWVEIENVRIIIGKSSSDDDVDDSFHFIVLQTKSQLHEIYETFLPYGNDCSAIDE